MESNKPETFKVALDFGGGRDHAPTELRLATSKPMNDQHLSDPSPILQAKLAPKQADYLGVPVEGPYKAEHYRY